MTVVNLICQQCSKSFQRPVRIQNQHHKRQYHGLFCSVQCVTKANKTKTWVTCAQCAKYVEKTPSQIARSKSKNSFCGQTCAAVYNNTHKTKGNRVSKLERLLQTHLVQRYPSLELVFNGKETIRSELDIYVPSLQLAFELNGIFHYEPIYGEEKLGQIQNNDSRKFQACLEQGIELCIIDVSSLKYFKEEKAQLYLNIVTDLIDRKLQECSDSN